MDNSKLEKTTSKNDINENKDYKSTSRSTSGSEPSSNWSSSSSSNSDSSYSTSNTKNDTNNDTDNDTDNDNIPAGHKFELDRDTEIQKEKRKKKNHRSLKARMRRHSCSCDFDDCSCICGRFGITILITALIVAIGALCYYTGYYMLINPACPNVGTENIPEDTIACQIDTTHTTPSVTYVTTDTTDTMNYTMNYTIPNNGSIITTNTITNDITNDIANDDVIIGQCHLYYKSDGPLSVACLNNGEIVDNYCDLNGTVDSYCGNSEIDTGYHFISFFLGFVIWLIMGLFIAFSFLPLAFLLDENEWYHKAIVITYFVFFLGGYVFWFRLLVGGMSGDDQSISLFETECNFYEYCLGNIENCYENNDYCYVPNGFELTFGIILAHLTSAVASLVAVMIIVGLVLLVRWIFTGN